MSLTEEIQGRETWRTRFGFILAAAGWSIGLGNIWRFPYITGKYGGGAFLLLYLICMMVVAIPLFTVEFSLGRASRTSITTGFRKLAPRKSVVCRRLVCNIKRYFSLLLLHNAYGMGDSLLF